MWLSLLQLALKIISSVADYLGNRQLIEAGKAQAINEGLRATLEAIEKSNASVAEVTNNPDGAYAKRVRKKYRLPF